MLTSISNNGAVRTLAFNRPEALNAFNDDMFDAVAADVLAASEDDSVKVLVITCLLYTSPSPRDKRQSRMPSSA